MEGKIEIGEYIRTKSGRIAKCTKIEHGDIPTYYFDNIVFSAGFHNDYNDLQENELSQIKKHSKNIIDLIEVGDFVDGSEVVSIEKK